MTALKYKENYVALVNDMVICMPQGGAIQYKSKLEAERHADLYIKGYTSSAILCTIEDSIGLAA